MKAMMCGKCESQFKGHQVTNRKFNFYGYDMKCPNCGTWLAPDRRSISLRCAGFVLWVSGLLSVTFLNSDNAFLILGSAVGTLLGMALFTASYKASRLVEKSK